MNTEREKEEKTTTVFSPSWKAPAVRMSMIAAVLSAIFGVATAKPAGLVKAAAKLDMMPMLSAVYPFTSWILLIIGTVWCIHIFRHLFTRRYVLASSELTVLYLLRRKKKVIPLVEVASADVEWRTKLQKTLNVGDIILFRPSNPPRFRLIDIPKPDIIAESIDEMSKGLAEEKIQKKVDMLVVERLVEEEEAKEDAAAKKQL